MAKIKVSIIVPIYNTEDYVGDLLESLYQQTYKHFEVIMVDDGSTDQSSNICKKYRDKDERFILLQQENQGPSAARNKGIKSARGEYIGFVDSDDLLHPDYLKYLMANAEQNNYDIIMTKSLPFLQESQLKNNVPSEKKKEMNKRELSEHLLNTDWTGLAVVMCKLYKKSLFDTIAFDITRHIGEDDTILYQLYWNTKKTLLIEGPLYYYRSKRPGSLTHSGYNKKYLSGILAFAERANFYKDQGEARLYGIALRTYCRRLAYHTLQMEQYFPEERDIILKIKKENRKKAKEMFFLPGNQLSQKCSAIAFAYFTKTWGSLYEKLSDLHSHI